jgi:hypothetical protein
MATRPSVLLGLTLMVVFAAAMHGALQQNESVTKPAAAAKPSLRPRFDNEKALAELRRQISGHENEPAAKVFMDVQLLKDVSAARLLDIMDYGYSRSLGTTCTHCHVPPNWESDEKKEKEAARGMIRLVSTINDDLLPKVKGLDTDHQPLVNCTTCHRGQLRPALKLE